MISTTGTTTPTVRPRSTSTSFRDRADTMIVSESAGESLKKLTVAVMSLSLGLTMTTEALLIPSPAAAPGQNQDVLIRVPSDACGKPANSTIAVDAPTDNSPE
jgi:hypothetical protein